MYVVYSLGRTLRFRFGLFTMLHLGQAAGSGVKGLYGKDSNIRRLFSFAVFCEILYRT